MNQGTKSAIFVFAAAAIALLAWLARPALPGTDSGNVRGTELIKNFDPRAAASLKIVAFDEDTSTVRPFEVAQVKQKGKLCWAIPSHGDYPADAQNQLADAATALSGLKILDAPSDSPGDHELYGVIDPEAKDLPAGSTGVGTRVIMKDRKGDTLLSLILGKPVPDKPELRYVRRDDEDPVYVVSVKTDKLSAKFGDWIEKDLLKMSVWDLKQVWIGDYSVDTLQGELQQKGEMLLAYDDTAEPKWKLLEDKKFRGGNWVAEKLGANEELNATTLDDLKTALENLKIVDVRRKPAGLSADLKANADFLANKEACESLARCGYFAATVEGQPQFLSNEGEVRFRMKDGVEYVLRFGAALGPGATEKAEKTAKDAKKGEKAEKKDSAGLNRYLLVMAEFNPEALAKPVLEPLPSEPAKAAAKTEKTDKPKAAKDEKADKTKPDDKAGKDAAAKPKPPAKEPSAAELKAQRERIEKENQRKRDQFDEQVAQGKKHVAELNARFADWYYVIADDVYRKLHLTRDQVVKKKEKKDAKTGKGESLHEHGDHDHDHHPGDADEDEKSGPLGELEKLKQQAPGGK